MAGTRSPVQILYLDESIGFLVPSFLRPDGSGPSSLRSGLSSLRSGLSSPTHRFITVRWSWDRRTTPSSYLGPSVLGPHFADDVNSFNRPHWSSLNPAAYSSAGADPPPLCSGDACPTDDFCSPGRWKIKEIKLIIGCCCHENLNCPRSFSKKQYIYYYFLCWRQKLFLYNCYCYHGYKIQEFRLIT